LLCLSQLIDDAKQLPEVARLHACFLESIAHPHNLSVTQISEVIHVVVSSVFEHLSVLAKAYVREKALDRRITRGLFGVLHGRVTVLRHFSGTVLRHFNTELLHNLREGVLGADAECGRVGKTRPELREGREN
jgi:hypothetical protein